MKPIKIIYFVLFFIFSLSSAVLARPSLDIEQSTYNLGELSYGEVLKRTIKIKNSGTDILKIKKVRASCECLEAEILKSEAKAGEFCEINFIFDTTKKLKKKVFKKYIYIQSNDANKPLFRVVVIGSVTNLPEKKPLKPLIAQETISDNLTAIKLLFFYSEDCRSCREVERFLYGLVLKPKSNLAVKKYDISLEENYLKLVGLEDIYKVKENDPMIVFVGERYFSGKKAIMEGVEDYVSQVADRGIVTLETTVDKNQLVKKFKAFSPLLILIAGLFDGINPCAFVTIIFLISFLSLAKKTNRQIFISGICFIAGVFVAYLLIGLSLREILSSILALNLIFKYVYFSIIIILFVLAAFSLYDAVVYFKYKDSKKVKLQLPSSFKKKIHELIRKTARSKYFLTSVFVAGFLISILESVCTGQIYLPTILFMLKEPSLKWNSFFYLILYNVAFVIPLMGMVLLSSLGLKYTTKFSQQNTVLAKFLLSLLFMILGTVLLLVW